MLSKILTADLERATTLLTLNPNEALKQINALGHDFTLDEFNEYDQALKAAVAAQGDELDADALDALAGGVAPVVVGLAAAIVFIGGAAAKIIEKK